MKMLLTAKNISSHNLIFILSSRLENKNGKFWQLFFKTVELLCKKFYSSQTSHKNVNWEGKELYQDLEMFFKIIQCSSKLTFQAIIYVQCYKKPWFDFFSSTVKPPEKQDKPAWNLYPPVLPDLW